MPKSKAKTAYGLLSEIRKLILEEPKRYNQTDWLTRGADRIEALYGKDAAPSCGTVGCVAGWVTALKGDPDDSTAWPHVVADRVLGLSEFGINQLELFRGSAAGDRGHTPGARKAHARRGAAHIARFQKKYAKQLKAKRV